MQFLHERPPRFIIGKDVPYNMVTYNIDYEIIAVRLADKEQA